ncbi:MAG: Uma2 family endonuclease [Sulfurospirillum sp.]|nr:Uma2 family endonuclease [Sulfurospirillum sp.]
MGALDYLPHYTYEDYVQWEGKWEVIHGIAYAMSPAPMIKHQNISGKIAAELNSIFEKCKKCTALLPVDWKIKEDTIVQPDNLVICDKPASKTYISKAPKIIFEILSKSTAKKDLHVKYDIYEREGVNYYIIVDPDEELANVYKLNNGRYMKVCDATDEKVEFELKECDATLEFDFSKIW